MALLKYRNLPKGLLISPYVEMRPIDWEKEFVDKKKFCIEIGSGYGEFLLDTAEKNKDSGFLGIEQEWTRVRDILLNIKRKQIGCDNIRLMVFDAIVVLERFVRPLSVDYFYCLFPCPWPKTKHVKYRLFSRDFCLLLNSRLKNGGGFQLVTDSKPYHDWVLEESSSTGFDVATSVIDSKFDTKYEKKWKQEGQKDFFEIRAVKRNHQEIPLKEDKEMKVYFVDDFSPEEFEFKDVHGEENILFKEILFDHKKNKALIHLLVSESPLTQDVWITIEKDNDRWRIFKTGSCKVLPTPGIAKAIDLVYETITAA